MSIYCNRCGAQLSENAEICARCGASLSPSTTGGAPTRTDERFRNAYAKATGSAAKGLNKTTATIVAAAVLTVALLLAIFVVANSGVSGATKKAMNAYMKEDAATLAEMSASAALRDDDYTPEKLESIYADSIQREREYFEEKLDTDKYKLSYEVKNKWRISESQVNELLSSSKLSQDQIKNYYGKVMKVELKITAKVKNGDEASINRALFFVKDSDKWILYDYKKD